MSLVSPSLEEELTGRLADSGRRVVLFHLPACPFCIRFRPEFAAFAAARPELGPYLEIPLTYDSPAWEEYGMEAVPTVLVFEQGRVVRRLDARPGVGLDGAALDLLAKP